MVKKNRRVISGKEDKTTESVGTVAVSGYTINMFCANRHGKGGKGRRPQVALYFMADCSLSASNGLQ